MTLLITFENPEYISVGEELDKLKIMIIDTSWILSLNNNGLNYMLPNYEF